MTSICEENFFQIRLILEIARISLTVGENENDRHKREIDEDFIDKLLGDLSKPFEHPRTIGIEFD